MSLYDPDPFDPFEPLDPPEPDRAEPFDPLSDEHHPAVVLAYSLSRMGYHCEAVLGRDGSVTLEFETELGARGADKYLTAWSQMGVERSGVRMVLRMAERRAA